MQVKTRGRVFGSIIPGEIKIHIAYSYGMNDGGDFRTFPTSEIPEDCRFPNTYIWLLMEKGDVLKIEKMTDVEIQENKMAE